jgi:hypothetical protein
MKDKEDRVVVIPKLNYCYLLFKEVCMQTSKTTVIGLLICLTSLYLMQDIGMGKLLVVFGICGFPIGVIVTLIGIWS